MFAPFSVLSSTYTYVLVCYNNNNNNLCSGVQNILQDNMCTVYGAKFPGWIIRILCSLGCKISWLDHQDIVYLRWFVLIGHRTLLDSNS